MTEAIVMTSHYERDNKVYNQQLKSASNFQTLNTPKQIR